MSFRIPAHLGTALSSFLDICDWLPLQPETESSAFSEKSSLRAFANNASLWPCFNVLGCRPLLTGVWRWGSVKEGWVHSFIMHIGVVIAINVSIMLPQIDSFEPDRIDIPTSNRPSQPWSRTWLNFSTCNIWIVICVNEWARKWLSLHYQVVWAIDAHLRVRVLVAN